MYISREIENTIINVSKSFQAIAIYGPRQVGKSTSISVIFGKEMKSVSLDKNENLLLAKNSPSQFLDNFGWPLIIDEIQKAPELMSEIKVRIDNQRMEWLKNNEKRQLMYVLTGSNRFELQEGVSESLAGRCGIINMNSLSTSEIDGVKYDVFMPKIAELKKREAAMKYKSQNEIFERIFAGGMPDIITGESERNAYFSSYIDTYIKKDVRKLINAANELKFMNFMSIVALRTGQQIEYSSIANAAGIDVNTCKNWLSILKSSGLIIFLQPYMANMSKRIIKAPKIFFMDTGLCAYLCKWPNASMLKDCAMSGAFFETYIVSEIVKSLINHNIDFESTIYYYRDIDAKEIDLLYIEGNNIYPIEIKKGLAPTKPTKNFSVLDKYHANIMPGLVIDNIDAIIPINEKAYYCPASLI